MDRLLWYSPCVSVSNLDELIKLAGSYEEQGLYEKAIESCNKVLQTDDLSFQATAILCRCYLGMEDLEKAITMASLLVKNYPANPDSHALRAILHHAEGSFRHEISSYERALSINPNHYESLCNVAGAYVQTGKFHAAADKIKRLHNLLPEDGTVKYLEGLLRGGEKRLEEEIACYVEALRKTPEDYNIWYNLGVSQMDLGQYHEAIKSFRNSIELDSSSVDIHFNLASAYFEVGSYEEAQSALQRALEDFPENGGLWYNLGYVYACNERDDEAVEAYTRAVSLDNTMADAYYNLAFIHFKRRNFEKAISTYRRVLELEPERFNAYYNLAFSLDKCKKYDEAIEVYKKILSFRPDDHKSYSKLAMVYYHIGDFEKVKNACNRSLEMEKITNPEAHYYLGLAADEEGEYESAAAEYRKVLTQEADYKDAHLLRSIALRRTKKYEEAKIEAKEAVRVLGSANSYYEMGRCYSALQDDRKAAGAYRKAIEIRPSHQKSIIALAGLLEDDPSKVVSLCEAAIKQKVKSSTLYYKYATALKSLDRYEEALKAARKSLALNKESVPVYGLVASLYSKLGKSDKAARYKKKFQKLRSKE